MFVLALVVTVLLLAETVPSALTLLIRARVGLARLDQLTRIGVTKGRASWLPLALGGLHTVGSAGVIAGLWRPPLGVAGAALEAMAFGWVLNRQLIFGDRGKVLVPYLLFTGFAVAVAVVNLLR
jgi:hypothetical protein